jgi:hypothetical protein
MADGIPMRPLPLHPFTIPRPQDIRPRPWLLGYWLMRGAVTLIAAPGGTGKTSLLTSMIVSCATGRDLLGAAPLKPLRVAFLGLEESMDEMQRRFAAAVMHHDIDPDSLADRIHYLDGKQHAFSAAALDQAGQVALSPDMDRLVFSLIQAKADVLFADPLALAHQVPENDNGAMAQVMGYFSLLGQTCNCAVLLVHHTRKGAVAGDPDSIRGAGALVNHARIALGLAPMTEDEAQVFNLTPEERRRLVRLDDLKMNYAAKVSDARWIKLESVKLGNATDEYPYGDSVQVATVWEAPEAMDGLTYDIANQILDEIEAGKDGERYSIQRNAKLPAWQLVKDYMTMHGIEKSDGWCRKLIGTWLKNLVLVEQEYQSEAQRKTRKGLFVNNSNRPGRNHD